MRQTSDTILEFALGATRYILEERFDRAFDSGFLVVALDRMKEEQIPFSVENIWLSLVVVAMYDIFGVAEYVPDFKLNRVILEAPEAVMFLDEKKEMFYQKTGISIE